ncbi:MAG: alpha-mannosidase [Acidobacteria bacterium]|nr:alpha-mannosidase [Acidobacteriota bacterium]
MTLKEIRPQWPTREGKLLLRLLIAGFTVVATSYAQVQPGAAPVPGTKNPIAAINGNDVPTLYVTPYAHLDTQWRWEYPQTIGEFLPKTMRENFALFEKYPHYVFNFSGANRYRMMKEYYPADYEKVKQYVAAGRWFPAGSSMEENDVNNPSAESIIRQILYGKEYFRKDFGKTSAEYMLPDCFGFPASLPSILAHTGIKGFSTQKLSWHSGARVGGADSPQKTPVGIPFNVGIWQGLDGKSVIAALNGTAYDSDVTEDLTKSPYWIKRNENVAASSGLALDFRYYGTGDTGGAPQEESVRLMEAILTKGTAVLPKSKKNGDSDIENAVYADATPAVQVGDGPLHVEQTTAETMFQKITPAQAALLPRYTGDLELTEHSAGSLTSEAYMKRWNRKNELLADAAERASVAADWMGGRPYPLDRLTRAWTLVMGGQFHDIVPGTATPKAYTYSWNDEVLAMNQFSDVLTSATDSIASGLDTQAKGIPVVIYNPLNIAREDVVEANIAFPGVAPKSVLIVGPNGKPTLGQVVSTVGGATKVLFLAKMPSVGYAVYDVQPLPAEKAQPSTLKVTESTLENARYRVQLDKNGDVSSFYDKHLAKELLSAPIRMAISTDNPSQWPAWNMDYSDQTRAPRAYVEGSPTIKIVENGPVRVALEITRESEGSRFVQTIRLAAGGAGNHLEFGNVIDWKTKEANLKATFPLSSANPLATYNWDIGTIQRGNDDPKKYEVASHQWIDLTDRSGSFGLTVLTDCKNGSDKPDDHTLRLTLLRSPGTRGGYEDQATQDWGHHEFVYGIAGHGDDWRKAQTDWEAERLNQPLIGFTSNKHAGGLGKEFSLLKVSNSRVRVLALKKAEATDEVVVRLVELDGKPQQGVRLHFPSQIATAREINGAEEPVGSAQLSNGDLVTDFTGYQPRSFALKLAPPSAQLAAVKSEPVALPYDRAVATLDGHPTSGSFDNGGKALPAEMLPTDIAYNGVHFKLAPAGIGIPDAVSAQGQTIVLPAGGFDTIYLLAAAADGDHSAVFHVGDQEAKLDVEDWGGFIGQWDNRSWKTVVIPTPDEPKSDDKSPGAEHARHVRAYIKENGPITRDEFVALTPAFIKPAPVAWFASHRHDSAGNNEPYSYSYLFTYRIRVPAGATTLKLPRNKDIKILALSVARQADEVQSVQPLYDVFPKADLSATK